MRLLATLATSAALSTLATSAALADPSGYIGLGGELGLLQIETFESDPLDADGSGFAFLASGAYMFTPVLGLQGDVRAVFRSFEGDSIPEVDVTTFDGAIHGFYREENNFLVGAFFQFGTGTTSSGDTELDTQRNYAGAEAQVFLDNLTLYGQAGLQQAELGDDVFSFGMNGWFASLEARYFLTPDLRIDAHVGASAYDIDVLVLSGDITTVNFGVGAEYKFENLPVSLFATYDLYASSMEENGNDAGSFDDHRVLIGAKFAIGEDSLMARDRSGASLKPVDSPLLSISVPPQ